MFTPDATYRNARLEHEARIATAMRSREAWESRRERPLPETGRPQPARLHGLANAAR
jgi:hypothetical protein